MDANIGLNEDAKKSSARVLNNLLSDFYVLLAKTWNFHWNVKGPSFGSYHAFLESLYDDQIEYIDSTAEEVRSLDFRPLGSLKGFLEHTRIKEYDDLKALPDALGMLTILKDDYETIIREVRKDVETIEAFKPEDNGTINYLEDMIDKLEKQTWMIRAHLE